MPLLCVFSLAAKPKEVQIEIAIKGPTGGGANNLNSISKSDDSGTLTLASDGKVTAKVDHIYKILSEKNGKMFLLSALTLKKNGEKDITWDRKIEIILNKKIIQNPFKGYTMEIMSSVVAPSPTT